MAPLCIDLFAGLFGWSAGFVAEGWKCIGFDIAQMGPVPDGCELVLQDVLTLHGSQFKSASIIVCSPPCQNYSYLAMPWSRSTDPNNSKSAKALRKKWETEGPDNRLFDACFRIQREACEAAGRYIPLIVENVRGAIPWVGKRDMPLSQWLALSQAERLRLGRSAWNYGSFHLWGDVPALMPINLKRGVKIGGPRGDDWFAKHNTDRFIQSMTAQQREDGMDLKEFAWSGPLSDSIAKMRGSKNNGGSWFAVAHNTTSGHSQNAREQALDGIKGTNGIPGGYAPGTTGKTSWFFGTRADPRDVRLVDGTATLPDGTKIGGDWFRDPACHSKHGSRSSARKMASAQIAKIPFGLSSYIAQVFKPR